MGSREDADDPLDRGPDAGPSSPRSSAQPWSPPPESQRRLSRGSTGSSADQRQGHHRRSSSLTSPPPPPEDFNPPADFATEDLLHGIQPPPPPSSTSPSITPISTASTASWLSSIAAGDETVTSPLTILGPQSPTSIEGLVHRPQIRAIQRLSQDSIGKSIHSSRSSSSNGGNTSDSSDLLAARRDELVSQLLTGEHDVDAGRRTSSEVTPQRSSTPVPSGNSSSHPGESTGPVEVNVISATPSHSSVQLSEDALRVPEAEDIRRHSASPSPRNIPSEDAGVHAWDSVVSIVTLVCASLTHPSGRLPMRLTLSTFRRPLCRRAFPRHQCLPMLRRHSHRLWCKQHADYPLPLLIPPRRGFRVKVAAASGQTLAHITGSSRHNDLQRHPPRHCIHLVPRGHPLVAPRRAHASHLRLRLRLHC